MFLIADARRAFTKLKQALIKAQILNHFDPERHIQIERNALGYIIGEILD